MRHLLLIILFGGCYLLSNCNRHISDYPSAEVSYVKMESTSDVIALRTRGYTDEKEKSTRARKVQENAEKRAMEHLLFKGIPNSPQREPLLQDADVRSAHGAYFRQFFEEMEYRNFITSSSLAIGPIEDEGLHLYTGFADVRINLRSLRRELKDAGVMPKFGL